jgi:hypothetical protein
MWLTSLTRLPRMSSIVLDCTKNHCPDEEVEIHADF